MRSPPVVVGGVLGQHAAQVPLTEDQHPVGDLGAHGQHEAFGEAVRSWTPWWDLDHRDAASARTASKDAANGPARSRTRSRNGAAWSPMSMTRLRACCVVQGPSGC